MLKRKLQNLNRCMDGQKMDGFLNAVLLLSLLLLLLLQQQTPIVILWFITHQKHQFLLVLSGSNSLLCTYFVFCLQSHSWQMENEIAQQIFIQRPLNKELTHAELLLINVSSNIDGFIHYFEL